MSVRGVISGRSAAGTTWMVLALLAAVHCRGALGQPGGATTDQPTPDWRSLHVSALAERPERVIELRGIDSVDSIAYLADSRTLVVGAHERAINVWELLHHYWPEELGALLAVSLLVLALAAVHVRRYPQRPGEPYCRGCRYCLTGVPTGACPECGLSRARGGKDPGRIVGETPLRRLRWPMAGVALIGAIYGGLFAAGVGRWSRAYEAFAWWSPGLLRLGKAWDQPWLVSRGELRGVEVRIAADSREATTRAPLIPDRGASPITLDRLIHPGVTNDCPQRRVTLEVIGASGPLCHGVCVVDPGGAKGFTLPIPSEGTAFAGAVPPDGSRLAIVLLGMSRSAGSVGGTVRLWIEEFRLPPIE